jgi:hypothetical protein
MCVFYDGMDVLTSPSRDIMGDMSFSGGFETLASGGDTEGWMAMVAKHFISGNIFSLINNVRSFGSASAFWEVSSI